MSSSKQTKRSSILGSMIWSFGERITAQLVSLIVYIVLARILSPDHYGIVSIVTVFITFLNVFVSGGFGNSLVQKKEADSLDFNTTFILSLSVAIILYIILFIGAPAIESFYGMDGLTLVIRVMGLRLIIAAINNIQQAYIRRQMAFKRFFWATLIGTCLSGFIGIGLAVLGFGVWALVAQYLTNVTIDTMVLFIVGGWLPKLEFSWERAKHIWGFGWKVLATELTYTTVADVKTLLIGKVFGAADLAFFDQGKKYPTFLVNNVNTSIHQVMLPALSKKQDDLEDLLITLRRSIRVGLYILVPLLVGFATVANTFVSVVLSDKWLPAVVYIQIFSIMYLTRPLETMCHQALLAIGRSGIVLICMLSINVPSLLFAIFAVFVLRSMLAVALFSLVITLISITVFLYFTNKHIGYKFKYQMEDTLPVLGTSLLMGVIVYCIGLLSINKMVLLIIQIVIGMITYFAFSKIFHLFGYSYLKDLLTNKLRIRNQS